MFNKSLQLNDGMNQIPHYQPVEQQWTRLCPPLCLFAVSRWCHLEPQHGSEGETAYPAAFQWLFSSLNLPSDRLTEPPSFKSSLDSAILKLSSSGLSSPVDRIPGEEAVNTAGPPFGGGISIPIRRYFLLLLLIHVCQFQNTVNYDIY